MVSPGGIGFDINCGVRLLALDLEADAVAGVLPRLADALFTAVPSGVGAHGGTRLGRGELDRVMVRGARWVAEHSADGVDDLELTEEHGCLAGADPDAVFGAFAGWAAGLAAGVGLVAAEEVTDQTPRGACGGHDLLPCPLLARLPVLRSPADARRRAWMRAGEVAGLLLLAAAGFAIYVLLAA